MRRGYPWKKAGADRQGREIWKIATQNTPNENSSPVLGPDNMYFTDLMEQGDRLVIRVRNPTGGALTARAVVQTSAV